MYHLDAISLDKVKSSRIFFVSVPGIAGIFFPAEYIFNAVKCLGEAFRLALTFPGTAVVGGIVFFLILTTFFERTIEFTNK